MQLPDDYRPAFPETGDLVADMVQVELDRCTPGGWAGTWLTPDAPARIESGEAIVMVHVMPGAIVGEVQRISPVNLTVVSEAYTTSVAVMQFLEDELIRKYGEQGFVPRSGGGQTRVFGFAVSETQQQIVFENPDRRAFESTFVVGTRKHTP